jgi:hypothetical protein
MSDHLDALGGVETPSLKDFWSWVEKVFQPSYQSEIEAYLATSTSHWEVEERIKRLQRRGMI